MNKMLLLLYLALLGIIAVLLSDFLWLAATLLLLVVIIFLSTEYLERQILEIRRRDKILIMVSERLGLLSDKVADISSEIKRNAFAFESRLNAVRDEIRNEYTREIESSFRIIAGKLIDIENRLVYIKKTFSAALGSMDERLLVQESDEEKKTGREDELGQA